MRVNTQLPFPGLAALRSLNLDSVLFVFCEYSQRTAAHALRTSGLPPPPQTWPLRSLLPQVGQGWEREKPAQVCGEGTGAWRGGERRFQPGCYCPSCPSPSQVLWSRGACTSESPVLKSLTLTLTKGLLQLTLPGFKTVSPLVFVT